MECDQNLGALVGVLTAKSEADLAVLRLIAEEERAVVQELASLQSLADSRSEIQSIDVGIAFHLQGEAKWNLWVQAKRRELNIQLAGIQARKGVATQSAQQSSGRMNAVKEMLTESARASAQLRQKHEFESLFASGMLAATHRDQP